jgi:hypothetical protein
VPNEPPPPDKLGTEIAVVRWGDPWTWLSGWCHDVLQAKVIALLSGLCFWVMALLLGAVFRRSPEYVISMASGCLLVSRCHYAGRTPQLGHSKSFWSLGHATWHAYRGSVRWPEATLLA